MKLLLGDALTTIDPAALPAGTQAKQISWINAVCQHLYLTGKWQGTTVRWKGATTGAAFAIFYDPITYQAYITLPRNILSLLAGGYGVSGTSAPSYNVTFSTSQIVGPWFEFRLGSYGVGDQVWGNGIMDAGDGWTTFRDITENSYLKVVTSEAEAAGAKMLFRGLDQDGNEIYTGTGAATIQGVELDISTGLQTQTTQIFSAAPSLIKKPVTYGPVSLYAVSVATGVATMVGQYDPGDTSPGFRRYKLAGPMASAGAPIPYTTLHAMVKRRFVPCVSLSDEVIPNNIPAIELGLMGHRYDMESDTKTADQFWGEAIALLNSELSEYNGAATPRIMFQRGSNLAGMPYIN